MISTQTARDAADTAFADAMRHVASQAAEEALLMVDIIFAIETSIHQGVMADVRVRRMPAGAELLRSLATMPEYRLASVVTAGPAEMVLFGTVGGRGWAVRLLREAAH